MEKFRFAFSPPSIFLGTAIFLYFVLGVHANAMFWILFAIGLCMIILFSFFLTGLKGKLKNKYTDAVFFYTLGMIFLAGIIALLGTIALSPKNGLVETTFKDIQFLFWHAALNCSFALFTGINYRRRYKMRVVY
jgi:hypothetical protein